MKTGWEMSDTDESFCKLDYYVFIYYSHEVVCKHLAYFLGTANLKRPHQEMKWRDVVSLRPHPSWYVEVIHEGFIS